MSTSYHNNIIERFQYAKCPAYLAGTDKCCSVGQPNTCAGQSGTCPANSKNYSYSSCPPLQCDETDCSGRGRGNGTRPNCTCQCDPPYKGSDCELARTECNAVNACNNHGTPGQPFQDDAGSCGACSCSAGYSGSDCSGTTSCTATQVPNSDKSGAGSISGVKGATVTVNCNNGYTGGGTWTCGADGKFSGTACRINACTATKVDNSDKSDAGSITGNAGDTVAVKCNAGYTGGGTWTCGADGKFSGTACSINACTATKVDNSDKSDAGSITGNAGDTATVKCNTGYTGGGTWTCGADGKFSGTACSINACTATKVDNSDKSAAGSITGNFRNTATVKCNTGYTGGGTWTCGADGKFSGTACSALTACTSANDCNNHAASVTGYRESGCSCNCAAGYTGNTCEDETSCTTAGNCSGKASAVSGSVSTGCTCTCNDGYGGGDCSQPLTACNTSNCGGSNKSTSATGYSETGCTCQCNDQWEGAECSTPSNPRANACHKVGFFCQNNGNYINGGKPTDTGVLPGTCTCIGCARGYTDAEGTCSIAAHRTQAECEAASPAGKWTPAIGYHCNTPNESCTLSTDAADLNNAATAENGVFYCAAGSIATISPYSPNGRMCGCNCGYGDQEKWTCENSALETGNLKGSCESNAACSYDGSSLTCQPTGYAACALNIHPRACNSATDCSWNTNTGCTVSETAKSTCLALSDSDCTAGSGCTLRGVCTVSSESDTRTGYGGPHCTVPQDAILSSSAQTENLAKGIIWCNENGVASGKTGNASCACFPGWSGLACQISSGGTECGDYGKKTSEGAGSYQCICEGNWSKSQTLNSDGVAICDVDPCHEGVTQEVAAQTFADPNNKHISLLNPPLKSPSIVKGMGISWSFADHGRDLPAEGRPPNTSLEDAQENIAVESVAPPGSREVTAAMENGNDLNAVQGRAVDNGAEGALPELNQDQQKELFRMQGVHAKNDTGHWIVIPTYGTSLLVGTQLNFFHKTRGAISCSIFDNSEGGDGAECKVVHGTKRSCGCAQGWDIDRSTELCTARCPYGTWGPGCIHRMDGLGSPDPVTGKIDDLCDPETLDDETIASLMKYNTEHGLPSRLAIDAAQISPQEFKKAMKPKMGHASCRVVETRQYANRGGKSLDIEYDCDTNPISLMSMGNAQVSSQWQKGSTQTPRTVKGGWVVNDKEGQCLQPFHNTKVLCEHKEKTTTIRENNGYAATDCVAANVKVGRCLKEYDPAFGQGNVCD